MPLAVGRRAKGAIKRVVKGCVAAVGRCMPTGGASRILTYHSVGRRDHDMNVTPEAFREQMEWLAAHYEVIRLHEAAACKPGVAVTFDDGFRDNLLNAAPIL